MHKNYVIGTKCYEFRCRKNSASMRSALHPLKIRVNNKNNRSEINDQHGE